MRTLHIGLIISALVGMVACSEPDCTSELSSTINLSFYKLELNEPDTVFVNELRVVGSDSVLLTNKNNVRRVSLPANPGKKEAIFVFDIREYGVDTLTLTYKNGSRLISEDCGFELIFSDLSYSRSDFDSIRVVNKILAEGINEDIRVYNN